MNSNFPLVSLDLYILYKSYEVLFMAPMRLSTSLPLAMHMVRPPRPWCAPFHFLCPQGQLGRIWCQKKTLNVLLRLLLLLKKKGFSFFSIIPAQPLIQSCGVSRWRKMKMMRSRVHCNTAYHFCHGERADLQKDGVECVSLLRFIEIMSA